MTQALTKTTQAALSLIRTYAAPELVRLWAADLRANAAHQGRGAYVARKPQSDEKCWCALGRLREITPPSACPTTDADWLIRLGADPETLPAELGSPDLADVIFWGIADLNDTTFHDPEHLHGATFPQIADILEGVFQ